MITLIILIYVILSVYISIKNMRGFESWDGYTKPLPPKQAIIDGFLAMPLVLIVWLAYLIMYAIIVGIIFGAVVLAIWILNNLP